MTTITTPARAVGITVHVTIDPVHILKAGDHPDIADDDEFTVDTALWGWSTHRSSRVTLHEQTRPGRCLAFYDYDIPDWLPRPPAEWEAAARAFIADVTAVQS